MSLRRPLTPGYIPVAFDDPIAMADWYTRILRGQRGTRDFSKNTQTANFNTDNRFFFPCDATAGNMTATLPSAADAYGKQYVIKKIDATANTVTATPVGADTIDGAATLALTTKWDVVWLASDGVSNWYVINKIIGGGGSTTCYSGTFITTAGSGTVNVPATANAVRCRLTGGGAAGGGIPAAPGGAQAAGGGGAGETIDIIIAVTPSGTFSYVVGAKGTGVSGGTGNNGTASSVTGANGVTYTAAGGLGGQNPAAGGAGGAGGGRSGGAGGARATPGGAGGAGTAEGIVGQGGAGGGGAGTNATNTAGGAGGPCDIFAGAAGGTGAAVSPGSGAGGSSPWGTGAAGKNGGASAAGTSATATSYGAAGSGAVQTAAGAAVAGGDGAPGVLYYQFL